MRNLFDRFRKKGEEKSPGGSTLSKYPSKEGEAPTLGFSDAPAEWTEQRCDYKLEHGYDALMDLFGEVKFPRVMDAGRQSILRQSH